MALLPKLSEELFNALPEAVREHYTKQDAGDYLLDVTNQNGFRLENVDGLLSTVSKQKGDINGLNSQLSAFKLEDGTIMDPNIAMNAIEKVTEFGTLSPQQLAEEKIKTFKDGVQTAHQSELDAVNAKKQSYFDQLKSVKMIQQAESALTKAGGNAEVLLPHVLSKLIMSEDDNGVLSVGVDDGNGNFLVKDGQGNFKTIADVVEDLKTNDTFKGNFTAKIKGGTGAKGGDNAPGVLNIDESEMTDAELLDNARR